MFNIPINIYNQKEPSNSILVKNIPSSIREKGESLIRVLELLESKRTTGSISETVELFPEIRQVFLTGNETIPKGTYFRATEDTWIGNNNFDSILNSDLGNGARFTVENKSYELMVEEGYKIWAEKSIFYPQHFYCFRSVPESGTVVIETSGVAADKNIKLSVKNVLRYPLMSYSMPYIVTKKNSEVVTTAEFDAQSRFTITATFLSVSREYADGSEEIIPAANDAVLFHIKDRTSFIRMTVAYDKDKRLVFYKDKTKFLTNYYISENESTQISFRYLNGTISLLADGAVIFTLEDSSLVNKLLTFSLCNDQLYGFFPNGSAVVGEFQILREHITPEEAMWIKVNPRSWSFRRGESYLDLTLDEKLKLKKFIETL